MNIRSDLVEDKRTTIFGMARSGLAIARLLRKYGAKIFVSEIKSRDELSLQINELETMNIEYETGGHTERAFTNVDFLVVSPGIGPDSPFMQEIERRHLPAFSEIEVSSWLCSAITMAITGSNGKSTTTSLTAHTLNQAGRKAVATGNIGSPFADDVIGLSVDDVAVVEVSSFQLERTDLFHPHVAAILNITPDHLDRYQSFQDYYQTKFRIADEQSQDDFLVLNYDDEILRSAEFWGNPRKVYFSTQSEVESGVFVKDDNLLYRFKDRSGMICPTVEISLPGPHNLANAAASSAMLLALGLQPDEIASGLKSFTGIPHRLEFVSEIKGVEYFNDSKATNVDSVNYAIRSIDKPLILIMGGRDKGGDFTQLIKLVKDKVKLLLLIGEASELIASQLSDSVETILQEDIYSAMKTAAKKAVSGDAVLLSPGCASFDQFKDFEDRGDQFKQAVSMIKAGESA